MKGSDDLQRRLTAAGLGRVASRILQLARPCYRIERTLTNEESSAAGSRFGGSPDVPAGFEWPSVEGRHGLEPMEFVAQIRLADLPEPHPEPAPSDGLLSFFTRWSEGRVFYYAEGSALQRAVGPNPPVPPTPSGFWQRLRADWMRKPDPRQTYRACVLRFVPEISPPDGGSSLIKELNLSDADTEAYFELCLEPPPGGARDAAQHQMFGYSSPVQNEMELECESLRRGEPMRWDVPAERFAAATRDWVLLLQVDTDNSPDGPGWMWGDAGMVYFWIRRDDLIARAFDKVVVIEQCH